MLFDFTRCLKWWTTEIIEGHTLFEILALLNGRVLYQIPLWHQRASHRADGVILWDYHVICVQVRILICVIL